MIISVSAKDINDVYWIHANGSRHVIDETGKASYLCESKNPLACPRFELSARGKTPSKAISKLRKKEQKLDKKMMDSFGSSFICGFGSIKCMPLSDSKKFVAYRDYCGFAESKEYA